MLPKKFFVPVAGKFESTHGPVFLPHEQSACAAQHGDRVSLSGLSPRVAERAKPLAGCPAMQRDHTLTLRGSCSSVGSITHDPLGYAQKELN
jgi:hypothetical protein